MEIYSDQNLGNYKGIYSKFQSDRIIIKNFETHSQTKHKMRSMYFFSAACILAATSAITVELTGENNDAPSSPASFGQDDETFGQTESEVGASSVEYPEADCCFFYSEKKYSGNKTMHCTTDQNENAGEWIKVEDQFMPNSITRSWKYVNSYRCGKNVKMNVC